MILVLNKNDQNKLVFLFLIYKEIIVLFIQESKTNCKKKKIPRKKRGIVVCFGKHLVV